MIIDGETYACEGCIRGHRARNCQHNDRPLQHIKAKGRPVSQCNHCRSERKNRSAHVKCQCGKRASEGGSDCGCFSGQKCRCATKKSPKQEPQLLGDISENLSELASPASTFNTASPAQLPTGADFAWSDAATPASNFTSLDGLAQFDPNAWISSPLDDAAVTFGGGGMEQSTLATIPATGAAAEADLLSSTYPQHFPMEMPDFSSVPDWPAMDDEATKQLLAMMDHTADVDLNGFDLSTLHTMGGSSADPTFGLDIASMPHQQQQSPPLGQAATATAGERKCKSKQEEGCGPCCG